MTRPPRPTIKRRVGDPFIVGDASVQIHAATCGTSTTYPGRCQLECECWCHYHDKATT